jgi:hypothetical protein
MEYVAETENFIQAAGHRKNLRVGGDADHTAQDLGRHAVTRIAVDHAINPAPAALMIRGIRSEGMNENVDIWENHGAFMTSSRSLERFRSTPGRTPPVAFDTGNSIRLRRPAFAFERVSTKPSSTSDVRVRPSSAARFLARFRRSSFILMVVRMHKYITLMHQYVKYYLAVISAEGGQSEGPMVIETPPNVIGLIDDAWFHYVTDFGQVGPDKNKGGKYLFLPPGYKGDIPDGYFVKKPQTFGSWVVWRGSQVNGSTAPSIEATKAKMRVYPLAKKDNSPKMNFVNVSGKNFNTIHPMDYRFWEEVNEVVQREPGEGQDPEILGQLASSGIKKGQPFKPDARMKKILAAAAC